ncbi:MAG: choice-of-anchor B family protein [Saprospiraceae bacterium]|jgi:choice-of-anchor B domain-containing protein|nr:choice-of-anchor B family protein [Saprospiraceae bacterium]MBP6446442.1 choice-of-anchor B family protein [Saprospiraceae bacterium]
MNWIKLTCGLILFLVHATNQAQNVLHQPAFNTELLANVPFGENSSDIWGMKKNGINYAVIGNRTKVSVFSLEDPKKPKLRYEAPGDASIWRDIKSFNNHLYVTADEGTGGVVIIDMTQAPENISHTHFKPLLSVGPDVNKELLRCHNLYIDENGFMYLAGCNISKRGVLIFDLKANPKNPVYSGAADLQYSHDAFTRGDTLFSSEINIGKLSIYDVKDKSKPVLLANQATSRTFTHNAWPSDNGRYIFTTDEKQGGFVDAYDISDLNGIKLLDKFRPVERENDGVIPHNTHYHKGYLITSWYTDGLRIVDAHRPDNLVEVAYYDTWEEQGVCHNNFFGCWGAFPFTDSDIIYGSDINNGLYIVKVKYQRACYLEGKITDVNGLGISNAVVQIVSNQANKKLSGPSGEYKTGQALNGNFKIKITHPEYLVNETTAELKNGEVTLLNVVLEKKIPIALTINVKDINGTNLSSNVLFEGEPTNTLMQTNSTPDFKASVSSGLYDVFITKWGFKNIFLPQVNISNNTSTSFNQITEAGFEDNFQTNLGWSVVNSAGVQGGWVRAVPRGTLSGDGFWANPNLDSDDQGNMAWLTGNGIPGANCNDVDNGSTELRSPNFDLTTYKQPALNFDVWFYAGNGTIPPDDTLIIKLSNGLTEVLVEKIFKPTLGWKKVKNIDIKKLIQPTSNMQLKIIASDQSGVNGHIVEAGFDQFFISELGTSSVGTPELLMAQLSVSPNPTHDVFAIKKSSASLQAPFAIYDVLGRMILSGILKNEETLVQTGDWQPGVYYLKAENHKTLKIIRQ